MDGSTQVLVGQITEWFAEHGRPLPWREEDPGPWGMLVVEVMSQQTPIARVVPVWREWMDRWPTPHDLASASPAEVIRQWGRMGYPRRALNLQAAAQVIVRDHGGLVPRDEDALLALPGVGPYTANAVLAFAFGDRSVVLDTNIRRVLTRVLDGVALPGAHMTVGERERADEVVPHESAAAVRWNAAVMEFGALVCTARAPLCEVCPVTSCAWRESGYPDNAPVRRAQRWHGSLRQVRGAVMAQARESDGPLPTALVRARVLESLDWARESDLDQALAGLIEDSLLEEDAGMVALPR